MSSDHSNGGAPGGNCSPDDYDAMVDGIFDEQEEESRRKERDAQALQHLEKMQQYFRDGYLSLQFRRAPDLRAEIIQTSSPELVEELHQRHQQALIVTQVADALLAGPEATEEIRRKIAEEGGFLDSYSREMIEARLANTIPGENWHYARTWGRPWDRGTMVPAHEERCVADIQVCIPDDVPDARCAPVEALFPKKRNDVKYPRPLSEEILKKRSDSTSGYSAQIGVVSDLCSEVPLQGFASRARDEVMQHIEQLKRAYPIEVVFAALFSIQGLEYVDEAGKKQCIRIDSPIDNAISHVVHKKCKHHYEPVWALVGRKVPVPGREKMFLIVNWDVLAARVGTTGSTADHDKS